MFLFVPISVFGHIPAMHKSCVRLLLVLQILEKIEKKVLAKSHNFIDFPVSTLQWILEMKIQLVQAQNEVLKLSSFSSTQVYGGLYLVCKNRVIGVFALAWISSVPLQNLKLRISRNLKCRFMRLGKLSNTLDGSYVNILVLAAYRNLAHV